MDQEVQEDLDTVCGSFAINGSSSVSCVAVVAFSTLIISLKQHILTDKFKYCPFSDS